VTLAGGLPTENSVLAGGPVSTLAPAGGLLE